MTSEPTLTPPKPIEVDPGVTISGSLNHNTGRYDLKVQVNSRIPELSRITTLSIEWGAVKQDSMMPREVVSWLLHGMKCGPMDSDLLDHIDSIARYVPAVVDGTPFLVHPKFYKLQPADRMI